MQRASIDKYKVDVDSVTNAYDEIKDKGEFPLYISGSRPVSCQHTVAMKDGSLHHDHRQGILFVESLASSPALAF